MVNLELNFHDTIEINDGWGRVAREFMIDFTLED